MNLFKPKEIRTVNDVLSNDEVKIMLDKFINNELNKTTGIILIYEYKNGDKKEYYHITAGLEPIAAIGMLDQCHHRVQHEGIPGY